MQRCRLHVTGASGSGTTTLGRALAEAWAVPHADVDDYYWIPTAPPYVDKRPVPERLALMDAVFLPRDAWVLSGSLVSWGESLIPHFDAVVFLTIDSAVRLKRLEARQESRYGGAVACGGASESAHQEFMEWASGYDVPGFTGRSREGHEAWLAGLSCPVIRLDSGAMTVPDLVAQVLASYGRTPT